MKAVVKPDLEKDIKKILGVLAFLSMPQPQMLTTLEEIVRRWRIAGEMK